MSQSIKQRFIENSRGFLKKHLLVLVIFLAALLADGISTIHFMRYTGPEDEVHPAVQLVSQLFGPVIGPLMGVVGKAVAGIIVAIYFRRIGWIILLLISIISFWAAWYNMWGWQYYEPGILKWWPF